MAARMLVGRGPQLAAVREVIERARLGDGSFMLVAGDPGIGKTALVVAATDDIRVVWGRGIDGPGAPAYWPWTQVLRALDALGSDDHLGEDHHDTADADRFRLFDQVLVALDERAADHGLVVVLDDLTWADADSLRLLEFVVRQLAGRRIAIVGTYRDGEAGEQVRRAAGLAEVVRLEGLSGGEVAAMVTALTGSSLAAEDADRLRDRTGGNPLFVRELARLAEARGGSVSWDVATVVDSVRGVIERRIARLSDPCARMLELAALDGPVLRLGLLGLALDDAPDLTALIDEAVAAGVLVVDANGAQRFAHDLFREVLDAGWVGARRRSAHLAWGRAMEVARAAGTVVHPAELAHQFAAAGASVPSVDYAREAAAEAAKRLAFDDAVAHLERALAQLDASGSPQPPLRLELTLDLAAGYLTAGRHADAATAYSAAEHAARQLGAPEARAGAVLGLHRVGLKTGPSRERDAQAALLVDVAATVPPANATLRAQLTAALARTLQHSMTAAQMRRARAVADDAVALARWSGDRAAIIDAARALHDAHWAPGSAERRLTVLAELEQLDETDGLHVHLLRAEALLELGDPACRASLDRACALAERAGTPTASWLALSRRAALAILAGNIADATQLIDRAERLAAIIGDPDAVWIADIQRWEIARFTGGRAAYSRRHPDSDPPVEAWAPWRALVLADAGDPAAAAAELRGFSAGEAFGPGVDAGYDLWFPSIVADAAARCGTDQLRSDLYDLLLPYAGTQVGCGAFVVYAGPVDHFLGGLAAALGRTGAAQAHAAAAAAQCRRLGAPLWEVLIGERPRSSSVFRCAAGVWTVSYGGVDRLLPDAKGLHDIAALLVRPLQPVSAAELAGRPVASRGEPTLDRRALAAYRARLAELDDDIDSSEANHDLERAARARLERDAVVDELRRTTRLGGRPRRLGDDTEKARKAVTARIHRALRAIDEHHPTLAAHLRATIETGTACCYRPTEPIEWTV